MSVRGKVVIAGAAETERIGVVPDMSVMELHANAARRAVADAGISMSDIDGVASAATSPLAVAHYLGITPTYIDTTSVGGCSFLVHVRHAAAVINAGMAEVVLITHGESGRSRNGVGPRQMDGGSPMGQFEMPYGVLGPPTMFPMGVLRFMKETGLTHEQLASVAVAQRRWSSQVPRAMYRDLITVDDVFASPMIAYPLHLLECCLVTDGGGALDRDVGRTSQGESWTQTAGLRARHRRSRGDPDGLADGRLHTFEGLSSRLGERIQGSEDGTERHRSPHGVRRLRPSAHLRTRGPRVSSAGAKRVRSSKKATRRRAANSR